MTDGTADALTEALEDEYKARATYRKIVERFGPVRPFVRIADAEDRHVTALLRQFRRLGLEPPEDRWAERLTAPESIRSACEAAVADEIANAEMYDRLLGAVSDPLVRDVLANLRAASLERHLPAFRRRLAREYGRRGGRGRCGA